MQRYEPYSVAEYKNLVGRAGRLGFSQRGTSYLIAMDGLTEHGYWSRYVKAKPEDLRSQFLAAETDPRSLIIRVLVAGSRIGHCMTAEQIAEFLESSFGVFQQTMGQGTWKWSHEELLAAIENLASHEMLVSSTTGGYELTPLGRLAGESGTEVESIVRLVGCLRSLAPGDISDPVLITVAQVTNEMNSVYFPMNKRSTIKEPQAWHGELQRQGIPHAVQAALQQGIAIAYEGTLRAKKAVACLMFVSGMEMSQIERVLTQHGGANDGAAGPIRGVATRTSDLVPVVARVAELLHPTLKLGDRVGRLVVRLTHGVPPSMVEFARVAAAGLQRGDYLRLASGGFVTAEGIQQAEDKALLACLDNDPERLRVLRMAAATIIARAALAQPSPVPAIPHYEA